MADSERPGPSGKISRQFAAFCIVGAGGFVVDAGVLALGLNVLGLQPYSGRVLSYLVAATFTWILNRRLTFGASHGKAWVEWIRYLVTGAVGGGANFAAYSVVVALSTRLPEQHATLQAFAPYIGVAIGSGIGLLVNFTLAKRIVFRAHAPN
jgi:putative flippase GtrA